MQLFKKRFFYILFGLSFILMVNFFLNSGIRERIFFKKERIFNFADFSFQIPHNWPLPSYQGNTEKGTIAFFKEYHPQKYNWYFTISWNKEDFDWKALLPSLKRDRPGAVEPEYIFGEIYLKNIVFQNKKVAYKEIALWIRRSCGTEERNWLFLFETQLLPTKRFLKVLYLSDQKNQEKIFRRVISTIKMKG